MDATAVAGGFATIVGLMADFAASRGQRDVLEVKDFLEWLRFHGHGELLARLEKNAAATTSLKAALAEGKEELLARLNTIEALLSTLSVGQGSLHSLALALNPTATLSAQAIAILQAYESAGAGRALFHASLDGESLLFLDGARSSGFMPTEPRFFQTDLRELLDLQLLDLDHNKRGDRLYQLTRRGAGIVRAVQPPAATE